MLWTRLYTLPSVGETDGKLSKHALANHNPVLFVVSGSSLPKPESINKKDIEVFFASKKEKVFRSANRW